MNEQDWDRVAKRFEQEIFNVPANDRKGLIAAAVEQHAKKKGVAFDIGCGTGRTIALLAQHFGTVLGFDVSRECLAIAAHKNKAHRNATYHYADLVKNALPKPEADFALCINTLLLADHRKRGRMVAHVCGAVRKGGHLALVVPSIESVLLTHARHAEWQERATGRRHAPKPESESPSGADVLRGLVRIDNVPTKHYSADELRSLLAMHGMRVSDVRKIEYPWSTEFDRPPQWMQAPCPWDWLVLAQRVS
ncbi:MAG: class I SAM-dependent methyltransferase [Flavobacteriales bacterium]